MTLVSFARDSEICLFVGNRRCGKTLNMRRVLHHQGKHYPHRRHLVWDPMIQFAAWQQVGKRIVHAEGSLPASETVIYRTQGEFSQFKQLFWRYKYHVIQSAEITPEIMLRMAMWCGGLNLWIDEIDGITEKSVLFPEMDEVIQRGAHFGTAYYENVFAKKHGIQWLRDCGWGGVGVSLVCSVRRLAECHTSIIAGSNTICAVRSTLYSDLERIVKEVGIERENIKQEMARLRTLPKPEMVRWTNTEEVKGKPAIWDLPGLSNPRGKANGRNGNSQDRDDGLA